MTTAKPRRPLLAPGETRAYPVLPLRDIVVFPHVIAPLFVGRKKSILALEEVMRSDTFILLATQKNASDEDPATEAIYEVGTLASVLQLLKLPDGTVKVLVEGAQRAKVVKYGVLNDKKLSAKRRRRQRYNSKVSRRLVNMGQSPYVRWRAGKLGHSQFQIKTDG